MDSFQSFGNFNNKRKDKRVETNLLVNYSNNGQIFTDYLKDISMGGARIETLKPPTRGDVIIMTLPTKPPIKLNATVRWVTKYRFKYHFGVEFPLVTYTNEIVLSQYIGSFFWEKNDYILR